MSIPLLNTLKVFCTLGYANNLGIFGHRLSKLLLSLKLRDESNLIKIKF